MNEELVAAALLVAKRTRQLEEAKAALQEARDKSRNDIQPKVTPT